jgi:FkbM family methyltransferase
MNICVLAALVLVLLINNKQPEHVQIAKVNEAVPQISSPRSSSLLRSNVNDGIGTNSANTVEKQNLVLFTEAQSDLGNTVVKETASTHSARKLYIDLGANCGNSYWRAKQGNVVGTKDTLKKPSPAVWESYLWECNPQLIEWFLKDLVVKEPNVTLIPKAATTYDGEIEFHLTAGQEKMTKEQMPNPTCDPKSPYQPGGASTIYGNAKRAGQAITVPTVNFLQWHKELNLQPGDSVHMKLDIEGAELDIIEAFLNDDTSQICYWDVFWIEYHKTIFSPGTPEYAQHETFETTFPTRFQEKCGRPLWPNVYI